MAFPEAYGKELSFWTDHTRRARGPVLELGCGTGRVLIPLLRNNIRITGIDTSKDMLSQCRRKCKKINLKPQLFKQSMQEFNLGRKFNLIIIPDGTIALIVTKEDIKTVFTNIKKHLQPGGKLIFDMETPYKAKNLEQKNGIWTGSWIQNGKNNVFDERLIIHYDPNTHIRKSLLVIEKYVDGVLVGSEANQGIMRFHERMEIVKLLRIVGFENIHVFEWISNKPAMTTAGFITLICRKM